MRNITGYVAIFVVVFMCFGVSGVFSHPHGPIDRERITPHFAPIVNVTASSTGPRHRGYNPIPENVLGGEYESNFWCAASMPAWLELELEEAQTIDAVRIGLQEHRINNTVFVTGRATKNGDDVWVASMPGDMVGSPTYTPTPYAPDSARNVPVKYVRFNLNSSDAPRSHLWKACLWFADVHLANVPEE